tara:strand:- start:84 stop:566 length:483 start_codon:yes stop_codon:yes gene_type:complete
MFEFISNIFSSSSKYIFLKENENENEKNDEYDKLLEQLISHSEIIEGIQIWCEENNTYYYMYYDWPRYPYEYVLKKSQNSMDKKGDFMKTAKNSELIKEIFKKCSSFNKFTITVKDNIVESENRKCCYSRQPIEFKGWKFNFPSIKNRYFAVSDFTYEKL